MQNTVEKPDHIPDDLVVDFDFYALTGKSGDIQADWATLHGGPDIVWTPRNGGHWIATRAEDIEFMQLNHELFSHKYFNIPKNEMDQLALPLGVDPPEHTPYRKLITPALLPRALAPLEETARRTAKEIVEQIAPRGECEFVEEFAKVMPIKVFLSMVDIPFDDHEMLLELAEISVRCPDLQKRIEAQLKTREYLVKFIDERVEKPGDDLFSQIIQGDIEGRKPTRDEIFGLSALVLVGGLDTVASQLGFIANHLAQNPDHRRQLATNPDIHKVAAEEYLRRFSLPNTARILTKDYEYKGVQFKEGDQIQLPKCLHGLDDRINKCPMDVDFSREFSSIKHAAFGGGPHTCPGAVLARREIMIFFEEWLSRIPDFKVADDKKTVMASGPVNGVLELHLTWDT